MKLAGWKVQGSLPAGAERSVLIAAPHTRNGDLPYTLMVAFYLWLTPYGMGKEQILKPPLRGLMMWLGGLPVDRAKSSNLVAASVEALKAANGSLHLFVPPEGTRDKTRFWKTGFYDTPKGRRCRS